MKGPQSSFAQRMRNRRHKQAQEQVAEERTSAIANGAADAAWQRSYQMIYAQFGKPAVERRDGLDFFMEWHDRDGNASVILNLGAVHSFMKRQTRPSVIQAMATCLTEFLAAPRTKVSFVVTAPSDDYNGMYELERWAAKNVDVPLHVLRDQKQTTTFLYVRSEGETDWFGRSHDRERPVMVFEIP